MVKSTHDSLNRDMVLKNLNFKNVGQSVAVKRFNKYHNQRTNDLLASAEVIKLDDKTFQVTYVDERTQDLKCHILQKWDMPCNPENCTVLCKTCPNDSPCAHALLCLCNECVYHNMCKHIHMVYLKGLMTRQDTQRTKDNVPSELARQKLASMALDAADDHSQLPDLEANFYADLPEPFPDLLATGDAGICDSEPANQCDVETGLSELQSEMDKASRSENPKSPVPPQLQPPVGLTGQGTEVQPVDMDVPLIQHVPELLPLEQIDSHVEAEIHPHEEVEEASVLGQTSQVPDAPRVEETESFQEETGPPQYQVPLTDEQKQNLIQMKADIRDKLMFLKKAMDKMAPPGELKEADTFIVNVHGALSKIVYPPLHQVMKSKSSKGRPEKQKTSLTRGFYPKTKRGRKKTAPEKFDTDTIWEPFLKKAMKADISNNTWAKAVSLTEAQIQEYTKTWKPQDIKKMLRIHRKAQELWQCHACEGFEWSKIKSGYIECDSKCKDQLYIILSISFTYFDLFRLLQMVSHGMFVSKRRGDFFLCHLWKDLG